jgi:hypothetical protein
MNARIPTRHSLCAVPGFCGLIYESIWSCYLKLFVGRATHTANR